jgi:hypothetical protein
MKIYLAFFVLVSFILIGCNSSENISGQSSNSNNSNEKQTVSDTVKGLEAQFKQKYDDAVFQLESETTKKQTEAAKLPTSDSTEIKKLEIERENLSKKLNIEKDHLFDLLKAANESQVKDEIQKTKGRELEKTTLDTNKRLAEIDRRSKDLSIKIKSEQLTRERDLKISQIQSEERIKEAQVEYNAVNESLQQTKRSMGDYNK